ncbi:ABC transporter substrate-binding protein [Thermoflexibacter ruber]|uniref:Iron complex transport system substrate-binding protein n=1 Tax=Thermoflexibacter ruber TaxID=1003 RepID=A0A1I2I2E2_9BACT|nr:ABC transporter substrate-binding protein [Thermoflexibacter ruber]SFF36579.1 iron complex transport system substrate-binding protein [Thermoflexibacter ruber]
MKYIFLPFIVLMVFLFSRCATEKREKEEIQTFPTQIKHAKGFSITKAKDYKILTVHQAWKNAKKTFRYILLKQGQQMPQNLTDEVVVEVPIQKFICLSTTHAPFVDLLRESEKIVGFAGSKYVSTASIAKLIKQGKIKEVGQENGINLEVMLDLQPDLVIAYMMNEADKSYQEMQRAGVKIAINSEYLEESPLGQAEWIKFFAAFLDKEREADSIFNEIENEYLATSALARQEANKPSVFTNIPYGGTWYVAGGRSFVAKLIQDAGANYIFEQDSTRGSIPMSIESVFQAAQKADFWLNVSDFQSLQELKNLDTRFIEFDAMKKGNIFNNNNKVNEGGGIAYWELGVARPDIVLKDLVKIFHPHILPQHDLYFYKKLK